MKLAGRATIFELRDIIGPADCPSEIRVERQGTIYHTYVRAVPMPFYDGLLARMRAAWEVICGRAYPLAWPEAGELETALEGVTEWVRLSARRNITRSS
jgi:hypothetical protein